ncbi:Major Facilitator Superfamily protein [Cohaesibacter marisflavi]|uniref:Major Facilitator Superfamily protein n=1 Tax=Cohaesibacter marisflavi TaxID=655353 RepID=A0A1I5BWD3_9HYPH|nr:MFS transporter [Cohaesibacter marisflavi]SFN79129.1 Major Facilitator Superfamily protein [Cohaesibacter marisflavi]
MLTFIRQNSRWLSAGLLLTFASSFGQTWFISLFATEIKLEFGLSDGAWGSLYTAATLSSALLMFWLGSLADKIALSRLAPAITLIFAIAALGFSFSSSVVMLGIFLFLLRFCGQGMFGHLAMTAMGRWFDASRGRAVSIAMLGHPLGEVIVPLVAVFAIATIGWNLTWVTVSMILILIVAPAVWFLSLDDRSPVGQKAEQTLTKGLGGRHWTRSDAARHWLLPALIPMLLTPGFIATVMFFHQTHIANVKGWSLMEMAPGYSFFASATVASTFLMGWASDRFGAERLLPVILIPMGFGVLLITVGEPVWSWYAVLALCGVTQGLSGAFWGVFLPVAYGTRYLGAIRALTTTVMVFSTAIGPGITGLFIDAGVFFPTQSIFMSIWCFIFSLISFIIARRLKREN